MLLVEIVIESHSVASRWRPNSWRAVNERSSTYYHPNVLVYVKVRKLFYFMRLVLWLRSNFDVIFVKSRLVGGS